MLAIIDWSNTFSVAKDLGVLLALAGLFKIVIEGLLAAKADRDRIRLTALHERRIEIVAEVYRRLVRAQHALEHACDVQPAKEESRARFGAFAEKANDFRAHEEEHDIWLSVEVAQKIDTMWEALKKAGYLAADERSGWIEVKWGNAKQTLRDEFLPLKRDVALEFRKLLGVIGA